MARGMQAQSYTNYFADALVAEARKDARIVGIHAAMGGGTGMNRFEKVGEALALHGWCIELPCFGSVMAHFRIPAPIFKGHLLHSKRAEVHP